MRGMGDGGQLVLCAWRGVGREDGPGDGPGDGRGDGRG